MPENIDDVTAFYLPTATGCYQPTYATMSPWDAAAQHGGPPAALLAHEMRTLVDPSLRLARITVDFLAPIPRQPLTVAATVTKPGRRVSRVESTMTIDGKIAVAASAWFIATGPQPPATGVRDLTVPPIPEPQPQGYFPGLTNWGYGEATDWRFTGGTYGAPGPADVWTRMRVPLVESRPTSGLERAILVADSANGLSNELPLGEWLFIPPTLTVTMLREPVGEWVWLSTATTLSDDGLGMSTATIADGGGLCGQAVQPLLISAVK